MFVEIKFTTSTLHELKIQKPDNNSNKIYLQEKIQIFD